MAFEVEDGSGSATATSFASVAEADAHFADEGVPTGWADAAATGSLILAVNPTVDDTVTLDAKTYTFKSTLGAVDGHVLIGASLAATQANLVAAVGLTGTPGTQYAAETTLHPTVTLGAFDESTYTAIVTAITGGTAGNAIVTTETFTSPANRFVAATLSGGAASKELALVKATRWLDNKYRGRWPGTKKLKAQALEWPRVDAYDANGYGVDSASVPDQVKKATIVMASKAIVEDIAPDIGDTGVKRISQQVGSLKKDVEYAGTKGSSTKAYPEVTAYLRGLAYAAGMLERG